MAAMDAAAGEEDGDVLDRRAHVGLLHLLRQRLEPEVFGYSSPLGVHLRE